MNKRFVRNLLIGLIVGLMVTGVVIIKAGDCDGTTGNDTIVCSANPNNPDQNVNGDLGNDNITVDAGVTVTFIDADGDGIGQSTGNGGNDVIVNNGTVNNDISGDFVTGAAGNDTITNNGTVNGTIYGDEASGTVTASGNDTIVNSGTVAGDIIADDNLTAGGNDSITNNGQIAGNIDAGGGTDSVELVQQAM